MPAIDRGIETVVQGDVRVVDAVVLPGYDAAGRRIPPETFLSPPSVNGAWRGFQAGGGSGGFRSSCSAAARSGKNVNSSRNPAIWKSV